eukprot:860327-Pyramimonas_sp.AAC.1
MPHWVRGTQADGGTGAFGGALCGAAKRCNGTHSDGPTAGFGGAPYVATKRCTEWGGRMWTVALAPSVELPM